MSAGGDAAPHGGRGPMGPAAAAERVLRYLGRGLRVAVVATVEETPRAQPGLRIVVASDGSRSGSLGDASLDEAAALVAREALREPIPAAGLRALTLEDGVQVRVFLEVHDPAPELIIVGAGHIAQPLCRVGDLLGFLVTVLDDRPELATRERFPEALRVLRVDFSDPLADVAIGDASHVVLVTRGHKYDFECLRRLVAVDPAPAYVGMIGSRRRVRATFVRLLEEGVDRERLARVRAPIGLDLGAQSPAEIAVAIGGELVQIRRGGTGRPLSEKERILERYFTP